ncbi:hypothetical protein HK097_008344, partial [Rhizophlyctis rosea]
MTEVFHIDGEGKRQGVVYCEMASRENTEPDLLDNALRSLLYGKNTTYSYECGGRTKDIIKLTNDEIIQYHKRFYHLDNMTVIICGQLDETTLFERLQQAPGVLTGPRSTNNPLPTVKIPAPNPTDLSFKTCTVPFPSSDEELGSVAFSWRGPPSEDIKTIVALDVLFRYLHETSASPFSQAFVERPDPYASQVDIDVKGYIETAIQIIFSGVPYHPVGRDADGDVEMGEAESVGSVEEGGSDEGDWEDETDSEEGSDEEGEEDGEEGTSREDLLEPGVYRGLVMDVLRTFAEMEKPADDLMHATIRRHRRKVLEGLEEDPHENIAAYLIPDIIRHAFAESSTLNDTRAQGQVPIIGTRVQILSILDELEQADGQFWCDLTRKWLLDNPGVEVLMVPDEKLAEENSRKEHEELERRREELGEEGLRRLKEEVDAAVKENEINLPEELVRSMPPVPDVTKAPKLSSEVFGTDLRPRASTVKPFTIAQSVETETAFTHIRLGFQTQSIVPELRPYFVLFQELLFQSPMTILDASTSTPKTIDYREVVKTAADLFVSNEAALGFGNDLWSASWLSEVFFMSCSAEQEDFEKAVRFLTQSLVLSTFTEERILTVAKNLISEVVEVKRDGAAMMHAVATK